MLQFPNNYFQDEIRDGFRIEAMMKCAWAAQLEVLEVFREFCEKHNLTYYADYGTLLGAVRHKGFIPWDDDIDLCMLRPDYERFLSIVNEELPESYHVHSIYSNELQEQPFARMVNAVTVSYQPERLQKFHGCPYVVGLDIFPMDVLPEDKSLEDDMCRTLNRLFSAVGLCREHLDKVTASLPELEKLCGMHFNPGKNIKNQLLRAFDIISSRYNSTDAPCMTLYAFHLGRPRYFHREWYRDTVLLPFENVTVPAPIDYDAALIALYGADYMIPNYQPGHEYPFYKKQYEMLAEALMSGKAAESVMPDIF